MSEQLTPEEKRKRIRELLSRGRSEKKTDEELRIVRGIDLKGKLMSPIERQAILDAMNEQCPRCLMAKPFCKCEKE